MKTFECDDEKSSQQEIEGLPAKIFKKFKQDGASRSSTVYENGVAIKKDYIENEIIYTRSTYFIPACEFFDHTWRLQVAAISDPLRSANEIFFSKIEDILNDCSIENEMIASWHFCKTYGEEFGTHENPGTNKTSRLYLQLDQFELNLNSSDPRNDLVKSCRVRSEGRLASRLQSCIRNVDSDAPTHLIIPPKTFVNKYFEVLNHKLQFESCDNLEMSSHLVSKI